MAEMEGKKPMRGIEVKHEFKSTTPVQLRFNDIDTLGHLNNSVYFALFDLGKTDYFNKTRLFNLNWTEVPILIASVNCDFLNPTLYHEPIAVQTQVESIGNKSLTLLHRVINTKTGEVKCVCRTVMVHFDVKTKIPTTISQEWRDVLCKIEGRDLNAAHE